MKKNYMSGGILVFCMILLFAFSSCTKDNVLTNQNADDALKSATVEMPNAAILENPVLSDATITDEMSIINDGTTSDFESGIQLDPSATDFTCVAPGDAAYLRFLNSLNLTKDQKLRLEKALKSLRICRNDFYAQLKKSNAAIILKANREREALIKKFKARQITEAQLKTALKQLNTRTKNALKENSSRKVIIAGLKKCFENYLATLKTILTVEQWTKLEAWYNTHK